MMNAFYSYFIVSLPTVILVTGLLGVLLWQKNLVLIILALEIAFISSSVGFILTSLYLDDMFGYIFSLTALTLAGAEVSLGLALAILMFRRFDNIFAHNLKNLKS